MIKKLFHYHYKSKGTMSNIFHFQDYKPSIDPVLNYEPGKTGKVLIIDNGIFKKKKKKKYSRLFYCDFDMSYL